MKQALRFTFDGQDYRIEFSYNKDYAAWEESVVKNIKRLPPIFLNKETRRSLTLNNVTVCRIICGPENCPSKNMVQFLEGKAYRAAMDNFCKEDGRKAALTKALRDDAKLESLYKYKEMIITEADRARVINATIKEFRKAAWEAYLTRGQADTALSPCAEKFLDVLDKAGLASKS